MINTFILIYKDFSCYEMSFSAFILRRTNITTVGLSKESIKSEENITFTPDISLSELDINEVDVFIIPGGSALQHLKKDSALQNTIEKLHSKRKVIASICGGPVLLANTGVLSDKKFTAGGGELPEHWQSNFTEGIYVKEPVVIDGNIITAKGKAVASFAIAIGKKLGIFQDDEQAQKEYRMIKEIQ